MAKKTIDDVSYRDCYNGYIVMPGHGRQYVIGGTAYRVHRQPTFGRPPQQYNGTMSSFCRLTPVFYANGKWEPAQGQTLIKNWSDDCTIIERIS